MGPFGNFFFEKSLNADKKLKGRTLMLRVKKRIILFYSVPWANRYNFVVPFIFVELLVELFLSLQVYRKKTRRLQEKRRLQTIATNSHDTSKSLDNNRKHKRDGMSRLSTSRNVHLVCRRCYNFFVFQGPQPCEPIQSQMRIFWWKN